MFYLVVGDLRPQVQDATILVSPNQLLNFVQNTETATEITTLESMGAERLKGLVDAFVREEVLYQEAAAFGLDFDDSISRQRAIQRLLFVIRSGAEVAAEATPEQLRAYFHNNEGDYRMPSTVSFANVFFSNAKRGEEKALDDARRLAAYLNANLLRHDQATRYGDRPLYGSYYSATEYAEVSSYFGEDAATLLFDSQVDSEKWVGPLQSAFGAHVVQVLGKEQQTLPSFKSVDARVRRDFFEWRRRRIEDETLKKFTNDYRVMLSPDLEALISKSSTTD